MHNTVNYSRSVAPAFDAVEDVKEWLGKKYEQIAPVMAKVVDQDQFALYCGLAGISGYPVKAWYEHFHGQGSWKD